MTQIGTFILQRLKTLNLTQVEAAEKGGFTRQSIGNWINGNVKSMQLDNIISLALVLQVSPYYLLQMICREIDFDMTSPAPAIYKGDHSTFVKDITYPDNSIVKVSDTFVKRWAIQNTGSLVWEDRYLSCLDIPKESAKDDLTGFLIPSQAVVAVPKTQPGEVIELEVELTAPSLPGTVRSTWILTDQSGRACLPEHNGIWCQVRVVSI